MKNTTQKNALYRLFSRNAHTWKHKLVLEWTAFDNSESDSFAIGLATDLDLTLEKMDLGKSKFSFKNA